MNMRKSFVLLFLLASTPSIVFSAIECFQGRWFSVDDFREWQGRVKSSGGDVGFKDENEAKLIFLNKDRNLVWSRLAAGDIPVGDDQEQAQKEMEEVIQNNSFLKFFSTFNKVDSVLTHLHLFDSKLRSLADKEIVAKKDLQDRSQLEMLHYLIEFGLAKHYMVRANYQHDNEWGGPERISIFINKALKSRRDFEDDDGSVTMKDEAGNLLIGQAEMEAVIQNMRGLASRADQMCERLAVNPVILQIRAQAQ